MSELRIPTDVGEPRFFCDFSELAGEYLFGVKWYLDGIQYGQVLKLGRYPNEVGLLSLEAGYRRAIERFKRVFVKVPKHPGFLRRFALKAAWKWAQRGQGCGASAVNEARGS